MSFPQTRATLIRRLAAGGEAPEWDEFHRDYWRPICRFARWQQNLSESDAEDVAAEVFATLLKTDLLARWINSRTAKLRTLLCSVTRNILANRRRMGLGRTRLIHDHGGALERYRDGDLADSSTDDTFYAAWACELLHSGVEELLLDLQRAGKGDYFRVLHSRICEELTIAEAAKLLQLSPATIDNYFRSARDHLSQKLRELLRTHVARYAECDSVSAEFDDEWRRLGDFLSHHGGLEESVRRVALNLDSALRPQPTDEG